MAKGKSKGRNNSGGGGTATIIGTVAPSVESFIKEQMSELGIKGNIIFEFRDKKKGEANTGGFVSFGNTVVNESAEKGYYKHIDKLTVIGGNGLTQRGTIAHEMKHLEQMQSGRFRKVFLKVNGSWQSGYELNGRLHTTEKEYSSIVNAIGKAKTQDAYNKALAKYKALPWEAEAYAAGSKYD